MNNFSNHTSLRFTTAWLAAELASVFKSPVADMAYSPLQGDASTRRYFRLNFKADNGINSMILMQLEKPAQDNEIDFTRILKYLERLELPVPRLFHYAVEQGLLFLEDCGDITLEAKIASANGEEVRRYYQQAVELIVNLQDRATRHIDASCPAYPLRFDVEKLMWEFNFMLEHFVCGLKQIELSPKDLQSIRQSFEPLCEILASQSLHFTHRDYHSRNLMVYNGRLIMLDFQDARMGPCQYDLASLLRDSYIRLEDALVEELLDFYIGLKEQREGGAIDRRRFAEVFDIMCVQRNLKAIGTFAFQSHSKKNDRYLESIPRTLEYVRQNLGKHAVLQPLRKTLEIYIPELSGQGR